MSKVRTRQNGKPVDSKETNRTYYKTYWNENMIKYLLRSAGGRWFDHLLKLTLADIPVDSVRSVADIGCGVGNKTAMMARHFKKSKVTGYDFSEEGIAAAKKFHKVKNVDFATADITESAHNEKFDLITAFDVMEHIEDWEGLTKKLIKANTRYMLISSPVGRMRPYEVHIGHVRNFKRDEIEGFMESQGYKTVKRFYAGFPFHSPILRDLTNIFYKDYAGLPQAEMSFLAKRMHDVWYFLFRYCSFKSRGDIFVGLFEKEQINA
jgi:2-polyprenyl-3-methyl-5-hydroxy-6-metoxy-1,4-benzoquinol methylase